MALDSAANFAYTTVATAPSPPTTGTTLGVTAGTAYLFATPPFNAVVTPASTTPTLAVSEILRVTTIPTTTIAVASNTAVLPQATINVASTTGHPTSGTFGIVTSLGVQAITYTGVTGTTFTGCTGGTGTLSTGGLITNDLLTIIRAQESTIAKPIAIGWIIDAGPTAKLITDIQNNGVLQISRTANTALASALLPVSYDDVKAYAKPTIESATVATVAGSGTGRQFGMELMSPNVYLMVSSGGTTQFSHEVFTVSAGRVITQGTYMLASISGGVTDGISVERLTDTTALVTVESSNSSAYIVTISATGTAMPTCTAGVMTFTQQSQASDVKYCVLDAETIAVLYCDITTGVVSLRMGKITGTGATATITLQSTINTLNSTGTGTTATAMCAVNSSTVLLMYYDGNTTNSVVRTYAFSPTGVATQLSTLTSPGISGYYSVNGQGGFQKWENGLYAFAGYYQSTGLAAIMFQVDAAGVVTQYGTNATPMSGISPSQNHTSHMFKRIANNCVAIPIAKTRLVIFHWNQGSKSWNTGLIISPTGYASYDNYDGDFVSIDADTIVRTSSITNVPSMAVWDMNPKIGIATAIAGAGVATPVITDGQVTGLSSLTVGATYYMQADGSLSTAGTPWKVGVAVSATVLQLIPRQASSENIQGWYNPYLTGTTSRNLSNKRNAKITYTADVNRPLNNVDATTANIIVNLPPACLCVDVLQTFTKTDSSANTVTITPNATLGDLINGATTSVLTTQYQSVQIMSNGVFYYLV